MRMLAALLAELTKQILLIFGQIRWRHHDDFHMLIALTEAAKTWNTFAF